MPEICHSTGTNGKLNPALPNSLLWPATVGMAVNDLMAICLFSTVTTPEASGTIHYLCTGVLIRCGSDEVSCAVDGCKLPVKTQCHLSW